MTTVTRGEQSVTSESVMSYSADGAGKFPSKQIMQDKRNLKFRVVEDKVDKNSRRIKARRRRRAVSSSKFPY